MANPTKIRLASPRSGSPPGGNACLVHIYPTGPEMGSRYLLAELSLILGRDPACEIPINNPFVSRFHARIQPGPDGCQVIDLQSTNGTFVNDVRVSTQALKDGDYIRLGNCIFRYLAGGNLEAQYHEEIHRLTIIDALTGIHNRRYLLEFLNQELARSARRPLALVLFDIDHFKSVNDRLGHLGGDYALREIAGCIKALIRPQDLFARYGGEEFVVVLPELDHPEAARLAEQFRETVEKHSFHFDDNSFTVTISLGVTHAKPDDAVSTPAEFIRQADEKMYRAKQEGRNRVMT